MSQTSGARKIFLQVVGDPGGAFTVYTPVETFSMFALIFFFLPFQQSGLNNCTDVSFNKWILANMWREFVNPTTSSRWRKRPASSDGVWCTLTPSLPIIRHLCKHSVEICFVHALQSILARHRHRWNVVRLGKELESSSCHGNHLYPGLLPPFCLLSLQDLT